MLLRNALTQVAKHSSTEQGKRNSGFRLLEDLGGPGGVLPMSLGIWAKPGHCQTYRQQLQVRRQGQCRKRSVTSSTPFKHPSPGPGQWAKQVA